MRRALLNSAAAGPRIFVSDFQGGISFSDDEGESWTRKTVANSPTSLFGLARNPDTGTICAVGIYRSSTGEVMRSTDSGENYSLVDIAGAAANNLRCIFVDAANKWFAFGDTYDDVHGSTNDGSSFSKIIDLGTGGNEDKWAGAYANGLWIIAATGGNYWTSTNGTNFTLRTDMGHTARVNAIRFLNGKWYAACAGGRVCVSESGTGDWSIVTDGFLGVAICDIAWNGTGFVAVGVGSTYCHVFTSATGTSWSEITGMRVAGWSCYGVLVTQTGRFIITMSDNATVTNGRIYTSDNNGASFTLRVNSTSYGYLRLC